jgi:glutaredoxin
MKKIIIIVSLLVGCLAGYLSYDLWRFNNKSQNTTLVKSIYSWKDTNGTYHFSDTKPDTVNDFTVSDAYQYAPLPLVYRIKHMASPVLDKITKLVSKKDSSGRKKNNARSTSSTKNNVRIFTTERCGYCTKAKEYFSAKGIAYTEYDIDKSPSAKAEFKSHQGRGVPLIIVNGNKIFGFNKKAIDMHLR